ncbi:alpha-hydroxy acid oxidase [Atlantibacter sp.]|uniref:alpha-hydroxy acid oxidase n=1 Tax=Atlantibacter sp. TaxID=1903473 RepID=UPI0028ACBDFC|nr:alpha-hydroxy acid oxidase [Atlantibacter sp.]
MSLETYKLLASSLFKRDGKSKIEQVPSIADMRLMAKRNVPKMIFDFVDGGAGHEITLRHNESDFQRVFFNPRSLVDVSKQDPSAHFGGRDFPLPIILGPAGLVRVVGNKGEVSAVKSAGKRGLVYTISTSSSYSIEDIKQVAQGPLWFQLYLWRNKEIVDGLIERAAKAECDAIVLTIDVPLNANRLRDLRNGMSIPPKITFRNAFEAMTKPRWLMDITSGDPIGFRNFVGIAEGNSALSHSEFINKELSNLSATWEDLKMLRERWPKKLYIKGILTVEDALNAVNCGVDGIIVSNHGGRQLDSTKSAVSCLPALKAAVGDRCEIFLDGGIRSGVDVIKALCMGADAVTLGRSWVWGVAAGGEKGVDRVIDIYQEEIRQTMILLGVSNLSELNEKMISLPAEWQP